MLELYGRGIEVDDQDATTVVERTAGVPASLIKELARRATLLAAERDGDVTTAADLHSALEELMTAQEALTRRLLGTAEASADRPGGAAADEEMVSGAAVARPEQAWFAYPPSARRYVVDG